MDFVCGFDRRLKKFSEGPECLEASVGAVATGFGATKEGSLGAADGYGLQSRVSLAQFAIATVQS
jgi:hypothetical protein